MHEQLAAGAAAFSAVGAALNVPAGSMAVVNVFNGVLAVLQLNDETGDGRTTANVQAALSQVLTGMGATIQPSGQTADFDNPNNDATVAFWQTVSTFFFENIVTFA